MIHDINLLRRVRKLLRLLVGAPQDRELMTLLADTLEEAGKLPLAHAYRWARDNSKWPYVFHNAYLPGGASLNHRRPVYDWTAFRGTDNPERAALIDRYPPSCWLGDEMIRRLVNHKERRYGRIHRAFILLAMALGSGETV